MIRLKHRIRIPGSVWQRIYLSAGRQSDRLSWPSLAGIAVTRRAARIHATERELRRLSSSLLRDIGIERCQIPMAALSLNTDPTEPGDWRKKGIAHSGRAALHTAPPATVFMGAIWCLTSFSYRLFSWRQKTKFFDHAASIKSIAPTSSSHSKDHLVNEARFGELIK